MASAGTAPSRGGSGPPGAGGGGTPEQWLGRIGERLGGVGRLGVAYSGGVDSSVLLAAAARVLGPGQVLAVLGVSPSLAEQERADAHRTAEGIGVAVVEVATHEGDRPEYRANGPDRCFFCKDELFARIDGTLVARHALDAVAYGENADDARRPDRPGARAATGHRVLRPLADAGLGKREVRALARAWGLPVADKPASPCLASRIPHHQEVTPEKLRQIDAAEAALRDLGLGDLRVRHHGEIARIEVAADDLVRCMVQPLRGDIRRAVQRAGFRYAAVDLGGLQSGAFTLGVLEQAGRSGP